MKVSDQVIEAYQEVTMLPIEELRDILDALQNFNKQLNLFNNNQVKETLYLDMCKSLYDAKQKANRAKRFSIQPRKTRGKNSKQNLVNPT